MKNKQLTALFLSVALLTGTTGCGQAAQKEAMLQENTAAEAAVEEVTEAAPIGESESSYESYPEYEAAEEADTTGTNMMEKTSLQCTTDSTSTDTDSYLQSCYTYEDSSDYEENSEEYSKLEEQGFTSVLKQPLSTFAADVDTASYSNMRRMITDGYQLEDFPEDSIRIEELLNYFSYNYKGPKADEPFGVNTTISTCPWNTEAQLMMIGLQTENIDFSKAPASNLVFLIDVSGSMYDEDKLPLLQKSFCMLTENLTDKDRVSIVTYAGSDEVIIEGVRGDKTRVITNAINTLEADGGTNGSEGIETAYALAEDYFIEGGNNRVILATDGDLNIGLTSEDELEKLISEKKESGVFLSVLGFGTGNIKDNKMETLADKGNGNYSYIDSVKEARKVLVEEMGANLLTICKDVKLQVEFNPEVIESYRLIGYDNRVMDRKDFNNDKKDGGEIGAGHSVTALYEIILKEPLTDLSQEEISSLKYADSFVSEQSKQFDTSEQKSNEWLTISIRYKKPSNSKSSLLTYPVTYKSYTEDPDEDYRFAAAVAEFGLIASDSEYQEEADIDAVIKTLKTLDLNDDYKEEFLALVEEIQ